MSCAECVGTGTLFVLPGYVDQQAPLPVDGTDPEPELVAKRAALANTVYPCPECAPDAFARWSGGAFATAPLGTRSTVPAGARRGGGPRKAEPLPMEPTWLGPEDWSSTRRDLD